MSAPCLSLCEPHAASNSHTVPTGFLRVTNEAGPAGGKRAKVVIPQDSSSPPSAPSDDEPSSTKTKEKEGDAHASHGVTSVPLEASIGSSSTSIDLAGGTAARASVMSEKTVISTTQQSRFPPRTVPVKGGAAALTRINEATSEESLDISDTSVETIDLPVQESSVILLDDRTQHIRRDIVSAAAKAGSSRDRTDGAAREPTLGGASSPVKRKRATVSLSEV